jgi:predicted DCC family thiol-disulfide oxidoreductase YuxK
MTPHLYEACRKSVHVITPDGRILNAGRASLFILEKIGYPHWLIRPFCWPPLGWFAELGYHIVAANRPFFDRFLFRKKT